MSPIGFASLQGNVDRATTVPGPAAWAMIVIGFGLLGIIHNRVVGC